MANRPSHDDLFSTPKRSALSSPYSFGMRRWLNRQLDSLAVSDPPPTRWWDWLLTAIIVIGAIAETILVPQFRWHGTVAGVVLGVLIPLRKRGVVLIPGLALAGVLAISLHHQSGLSFPTIAIGLMIIMYTTVRWGPPAAIIIGFLVISGVDITLVWLMEESVPWPTYFADATVLAVLIAFGIAMRYRSSLSSQRILQARLEERQQLARELHDVVAHHVSAIAVLSEAAQLIVHDHPDAADRSLDQIHIAATSALDDMRRLVGILRGEDSREPLAGSVGLRELVDAPGRPVAQLRGHDTIGDDLPIAVRAGMYRIVQEALTNARRYGSSTDPIDVLVSHELNYLSVQITSRLQSSTRPVHGPHHVDGTKGFGIVGMRERAEALGGTLEAGQLSGRWWRVKATLPTGTAPTRLPSTGVGFPSFGSAEAPPSSFGSAEAVSSKDDQ